jgi:CBS domain-containing membrane protein
MVQLLARDIMLKDVRTISEDKKVAYARLVMMRHNIGALPVLGKDRKLVGIITQRDADFAGSNISDLHVSDLMTTTLVKGKETTTLREIVEWMIKTGIQRIPITDDKDRLVGLVTQTSVIRAIAKYDIL